MNDLSTMLGFTLTLHRGSPLLSCVETGLPYKYWALLFGYIRCCGIVTVYLPPDRIVKPQNKGKKSVEGMLHCKPSIFECFLRPSWGLH